MYLIKNFQNFPTVYDSYPRFTSKIYIEDSQPSLTSKIHIQECGLLIQLDRLLLRVFGLYGNYLPDSVLVDLLFERLEFKIRIRN